MAYNFSSFNKFISIFPISKVSLSDPLHEVMITRTSLWQGPTLYFGFMGGPILTEDLRGTCNPLYMQWVVVETIVSDEIAFHANWLVTKAPLFLQFARLWD